MSAVLCEGKPGAGMSVAALFVRKDSIYRELGADCFDLARDARTFDLSCPVVAHPPCRAWAKLKGFAKPRDDEKDLARWAMHVVRHCGGVLEHPVHSDLWREAGVGTPGVRDAHGGLLVTCLQQWWGHRAPKATGLYLVGLPAPSMPDGQPVVVTRAVEKMCRAERERTPPAFASMLFNLARLAA